VLGFHFTTNNYGKLTTTTTTVLKICLILAFNFYQQGQTANAKNKDDTFNINITMPKFNSTQVRSNEFINRSNIDFIYLG